MNTVCKQMINPPRATKQSRVKRRCHYTVPVVPTQGAIPEEGGQEKKPFIHISSQMIKEENRTEI